MVGLTDLSLLPVQLFHDFCHFSDISFVVHGSSSEAGDFSAVTVREKPSFAAESAFSFPGMPTWLGNQHKTMVRSSLLADTVATLNSGPEPIRPLRKRKQTERGWEYYLCTQKKGGQWRAETPSATVKVGLGNNSTVPLRICPGCLNPGCVCDRCFILFVWVSEWVVS